ncbi:MAG: 3-phosphoshikimate 1-carboxyvinyltransferase [Puniceicoccales bacterium]|jgi:3-phosphoshikimate 1-carboxyvinyltransferase|nr:3-phosphoshikimate 1-carboxyvinyltransferase [Puniceicoccales bacterium]
MTVPLSRLPIQPPAHNIDATVALPGSKSITNRALVLAALANGETTLCGALFSRDTRIMVSALQTLGFHVDADEAAATIRIRGLGGEIPAARATLQLGNAGTAARFLPALLALHPCGEYTFECDDAMRARPMSGLFAALTAQGSRFITPEALPATAFPCIQQTGGLRGGDIHVNAGASSQILSALLMAAPFAPRPTRISLDGPTVSKPFVAMTLRMLSQFGHSCERTGPPAAPSANAGERPATESYDFHPARPHGACHAPGTYSVEPDATAASYFLALPISTPAKIHVRGFSANPLQGDIAFLDILRRLGLPVASGRCGNALPGAADFCSTTSTPAAPLPGGDFDFNAISDTFLTLAAIAPLLSSPTTLRNIAHARRQETDRVLAVATELERLGQRTTPTASELRANPSLGDLTIHPDLDAMRRITARAPVLIHTYEDHRIAMSFAILGLHNLHGDARSWLHIENPGCVAKTFPNFFSILAGL